MNGARRYFVDTNVLLYLTDTTERERQAKARSWLTYLWECNCGALSWQVLHEFYANAVRKLGVPREDARFLVGAYLEWHPVENSPALLQRAWRWMDDAQLSYWDASILASAEMAGCEFLLSEDFQAGRRYGGIEVLNPFGSSPPDVFKSRI
jgi:predicted nucleic acid-binding protein